MLNYIVTSAALVHGYKIYASDNTWKSASNGNITAKIFTGTLLAGTPDVNNLTVSSQVPALQLIPHRIELF